MSSEQIIIIVVVVAVIIIAAAVIGLVVGRRRRELREQFGPEYDHVVEQRGSRREAEQELREREQRHEELKLRPLPESVRERYALEWREVQAEFVDTPGEAVSHADRLVTALMSDRGYPTDDYDQQVADLSVEHGRTLGHYRAAHEISERRDRGDAETEDLRQAMVHYRALFGDLLERAEPPEPAIVDRAETETAGPSNHARRAEREGQNG